MLSFFNVNTPIHLPYLNIHRCWTNWGSHLKQHSLRLLLHSQPASSWQVMMQGVRCHFICNKLHWSRDLSKIASGCNLKKMTAALPPEDFKGDDCTCTSQYLQHRLLCLTNNGALKPQLHCLLPYLPLAHQLLKYQSIISQAYIKPSLHEKNPVLHYPTSSLIPCPN